MSRRNGIALVLPLVAALSVIADRITKYLVRVSLSPGQSLDLAPWATPLFQITYVRNSGAAFGLFPGGSTVFMIIAVIVIVALVWYYLHLPDASFPIHLALGLQLGGATGNLIDRLRFDGMVIDFFDLNFWPMRRWPVFNVADASIVAGVVILTALMVWEGWQEGQSSRSVPPGLDD